MGQGLQAGCTAHAGLATSCCLLIPILGCSSSLGLHVFAERGRYRVLQKLPIVCISRAVISITGSIPIHIPITST